MLINMTYCQSIDCSSLADARTSVRTNEPPNRMRLLTYVDKHNIDNLSLVLRLRTHERTSLRGVEDSLRTGARPAQGTATTTGDGLVRGRTRHGHYNCRWFGAWPAQGSATTTGDGLVRGRHKARPLQLAMVWCEAGTRHGHYNWRWFGSRSAQGMATTTGDGLVRGRHKARSLQLRVGTMGSP